MLDGSGLSLSTWCQEQLAKEDVMSCSWGLVVSTLVPTNDPTGPFLHSQPRPEKIVENAERPSRPIAPSYLHKRKRKEKRIIHTLVSRTAASSFFHSS